MHNSQTSFRLSLFFFFFFIGHIFSHENLLLQHDGVPIATTHLQESSKVHKLVIVRSGKWCHSVEITAFTGTIRITPFH